MESVAGSTTLSQNVSLPSCDVSSSSCGVATTLSSGLRGALDGGQVRGRHGEGDEHRLDLRDGRELAGIRGDEVAGLDGDVAGAAVDGGHHRGVGQLHARGVHRRFLHGQLGLGAFHGGLVGRHGQRRGLGLRARLVAGVPIEDALADELGLAIGVPRLVLRVGGVAGQLRLGLIDERAIPYEVGLRLQQGRFERALVDREEQRPLLDEVALLEAHGLERARHLRADCDGAEGLDVAHGLDVHGHVLLRDLGDHYRLRATPAAPAPSTSSAAIGSARRGHGTAGHADRECTEDRQRRR